MIFRYPSTNTRVNNLTVSKIGSGYFYNNKKNVLSCGTSTTIPDTGRLKIIILWFLYLHMGRSA